MKPKQAVLLGACAFALAAPSWAERGLVKFPEKYAEGIRYAVVPRGDIRQELYTSRAAIDAARADKPLPDGTVITLVDIRGAQVHRYVVMEKRAGAGTVYPPEVRNGDWLFEVFNADRSVNLNDDVKRCLSCHQPQAKTDYIFTFDHLKRATR